MKALFFCLVLVCLVGQPGFTQQITNPEELIVIGDESASQDEPGTQDSPVALVSTWDFVRMVLILAGVVGVIYLFFFLLKRGTRSNITENNLIRIHDYRTLGGARGLYLIEVGTSIYLIGASENDVSLISEITEKESVDTLRLALAQNGTSGLGPAKKSFGGMLGDLFGSSPRASSGDTGLQFIKKQKERLRRLQ